MALIMDPKSAGGNPPPRDTNRLKDIAVDYPDLIISGSPTYWILDHGTAAARAIQIDFHRRYLVLGPRRHSSDDYSADSDALQIADPAHLSGQQDSYCH